MLSNLETKNSNRNEFSLAIEFREAGKYQEAQEWLNTFIVSHPNDPEALSLLSQVLLLDKKDAESEKVLLTAASLNSELPSIYRNQARLLLKQSKPVEALEKGQSGYERSPNDPESWLVLAACLGANQRDQDALTLIEKVLEARPNNAEAFASRALIWLRAKDISEAIKDAEMSVSLKPHLTQIWGLLGSLHYQSNNLSGATQALKKAHENEPNNVDYMIGLGEFLRQENKAGEAIAILEKATKLAPGNANVWTNLGVAFQQDKQIGNAKKAYEKSVAINPKLAEVSSNLGLIAMDARDWDSALQYFEKALVIKPGLAKAHSGLGATLQKMGRLDEAEASHRQAIGLNSDYAEAHCNLGNTLKELGRLDEAEASYTQAIALKPDLADAHYNLGNTLKELGRLDETEASLRQAIALKPDYAEAHHNLGATLQVLGRLGETEASLRQAIALKPDLADAHYNLGNTLKELGRLEEAEASLRQAIALKPDYTDAHYSLGLTFNTTGKFEEAIEQFSLINFKKSKSHLLRCLYLQDKRSLFFDLLDTLINQGETNSMIGSLGCRSVLSYGIERPNLFCKEPLKYVLKTDLKNQYDFGKIFVNTAITILNDNRVEYRTQRLLTNGSQTYGNLFDLEPDFTEEIQNIIRAEVDKYRFNLKDSEEGFIKNWPADYSISGWLVSMRNGGELRPHMHSEGWISGSIYINVPPKLKTDSGNFVVCIEDETFVRKGVKSPKKIIDVVTGNLVLFPASLLHYTIPFESEEERIVLAFDVVPK